MTGFVRGAIYLASVVTLAATAPPPVVPSGVWQIRSTVATLDVPGVPGFLQRIAKGHVTAERKCLGINQTMVALLAPDPKAQCHVDRLEIVDGRYTQTLTCPQKGGTPITVTRAGSYDANGFAGQATARGVTSRGPISIVLDQRAIRTKPVC